MTKRPYDEDYMIAPNRCILTGKWIPNILPTTIYLQTNLGRKLFKLWLDPKFDLMRNFELKKLIQDTIGSPININMLFLRKK